MNTAQLEELLKLLQADLATAKRRLDETPWYAHLRGLNESDKEDEQ